MNVVSNIFVNTYYAIPSTDAEEKEAEVNYKNFMRFPLLSSSFGNGKVSPQHFMLYFMKLETIKLLRDLRPSLTCEQAAAAAEMASDVGVQFSKTRNSSRNSSGIQSLADVQLPASSDKFKLSKSGEIRWKLSATFYDHHRHHQHHHLIIIPTSLFENEK